MANGLAGALRSVAKRRIFCGALVASLSLVFNCAIALHNGLPVRRVQDEFSYLLAGDTFAHCRLTNPAPPFPEHFETPHVLLRPTYMSKYPPGQGIALAIGQWMSDQPIIGVWLATAAACAAIYWMLLAFVDGGWALVGGVIAVMHPELIAWSQTYWGGSVAVLGGALMIGAWGRLLQRISMVNSLALGAALAILANSRPYEGLILSIVPMIVLISRARGRSLSRLTVGLTVVLFPVALAMCYYNFRVTGHPFRMPFMEYSAQYDVYPKFWFLPKHPQPIYSSPAVASIHTDYERGDYDRLQTPGGVAAISAQRLWQFISIYMRPYWLLAPLIIAAFFVCDSRLKWIWLTLVCFLAGICAETWFMPAYSAPAAPLMVLMVVIGIQKLWSWNRPSRMVCGMILLSWLATAAFPAAAPPPADAIRFGRADLIAQYPELQRGRQLIFVQYQPGHLIHDEWVYNAADLANSQIVWARYLGKSADTPLIHYFPDRQDWLLQIDGNQLRLNRYP